MRRRWIVLAICALVVVGVLLLVPSLDAMRFEPGKPALLAVDPARPLALPPLTIPDDIPVWQILLLWLAFVVNLALFFLLLPPEVRKRILRQLISFALGVLLVLLILRFHVIQLPEALTEPAGVGPSAIAAPGGAVDSQTFRPPQVAPWITYAIGLALLWLVLLGLYYLYRLWQRYRGRRQATLDDIGKIARRSLADLASGREWGDVVLQAYARMSEAVRLSRGLHRDSSSTPREFAARLARTGLPASSVEELTRLFELVRYGGRTSDVGEARRATDCLESILRACGSPA